MSVIEPVVLPRIGTAVPTCTYCWGQASAFFGYGPCPYCGGTPDLDALIVDLEDENTLLEKRLEEEARRIDEITTEFAEKKRMLLDEVNHLTLAVKASGELPRAD